MSLDRKVVTLGRKGSDWWGQEWDFRVLALWVLFLDLAGDYTRVFIL